MAKQLLFPEVMNGMTEFWTETIFRPWFRHWRTGKIVHAAPGHAFRLRIKHYR